MSIHHRLPQSRPGDRGSYAEMLISARRDPIKVRKESSLSLAFKGFDASVPTEPFLSECDPASIISVMNLAPEEKAYLSVGVGRGR